MDALAAARAFWPARQTVRVGVTGLARSGKTTLLTSLAANLLALGGGVPCLPDVSTQLAGRPLRVALSPSGEAALPRFDHAAHLAAFVADPPRWPARTEAVSLLSLDLDIGRQGFASVLPPRLLRLEFLDYPGEWLLDLPLLGQDFAAWSAATLARLRGWAQAAPFLAFATALPAHAPEDEALAREGHALYVACLRRLRDEAGLSLLQPGRFLMPPPGPPAPYLSFFPLSGTGGLTTLMARRFEAYQAAVRRDLTAPGFGAVDRLVVLADVLSALHQGPAAFADVAAALGAVGAALRARGGAVARLPLVGPALAPVLTPVLALIWPALGGIVRVAYCATKADQVARAQRGNLAALLRRMVGPLSRTEAAFALSAARCTEDVVWTLDGRPVSAVRGRVAGEGRAGRFYPGEVPDRMPDADFWAHPFLALPDFEPLRVPLAGRGGVANLEVDRLISFLVADLL
jgi:predicted YcjX-like family ATPase